MTATEPTRTTTRRLLVVSIALAALCAGAIQAVAGSWIAAGAALIAAAFWVALRHPRVARSNAVPAARPEAGRPPSGHRGRGTPAPRVVTDLLSSADLLVQASFLVLGVLMVAALAFRLLPVGVAGMWLLVCAADLDRLLARYPSHSPARVRRAVLARHLKLLGFVGGAAFAVVSVTILVTIEVRLPAAILVAAFVVVVLVRIVRSISRGERPEGSEPE